MACCHQASSHWPSYRMPCSIIVRQWVNSLWPSDAIWQQRPGSTLAQVMACCLTAPSHYLNQCWLIISGVQWHSYQGNFMQTKSSLQSDRQTDGWTDRRRQQQYPFSLKALGVEIFLDINFNWKLTNFHDNALEKIYLSPECHYSQWGLGYENTGDVP